jgi:hypothetical protein
MNSNYLLTVLTVSVVLLTTNCTGKKESEKLEKIWETEGFDTPECVIFDSEKNVYYVSNIGGKDALNKDGNGFISVLNPDGSINNLKYIEGLNAPKGMGILEDTLFVTDIDRIVKINLGTGEIFDTIPVKNAIFLNDIAIDNEGNLFISDSKARNYIKLSDTTYQTFVTDTIFKFPNGIIYDKDRLISGIGDKVISIDPKTGMWETFINNTGSVDGLQKVNETTYIISDWKGKIHLISPEKDKELLLDTTVNEGENAADFCFNNEDNLLFVPTFFKNSIACYKLNL